MPIWYLTREYVKDQQLGNILFGAYIGGFEFRSEETKDVRKYCCTARSDLIKGNKSILVSDHDFWNIKPNVSPSEFDGSLSMDADGLNNTLLQDTSRGSWYHYNESIDDYFEGVYHDHYNVWEAV